MAAGRVLGGSGGLGLLLSGLPALCVAAVVLYMLAWILTPRLYDTVDHVLAVISSSFRWSYAALSNKTANFDADQVPLINLEDEQSASSGSREASIDLPRAAKPPPNTFTAFMVSIATLTAVIVVAILQLVRPITPPYAHMSGSLPMTLIEAVWFQPINSEFCLPHPVEVALFPFEQFNTFFNRSRSIDWMPQAGPCRRANGPGPPPWLEHPGGDGPGGHGPGRGGPGRGGPGGHGPHGPRKQGPRSIAGLSHPNRREPPPLGPPPPPGPPPPGPPPPHGSDDHGPPRPGLPAYGIPANDEYEKGFRPKHRGHGHQGGYEPICDPLKLSNLNETILEALSNSWGGKKPKIKNILLLTLESTRKDMFPFKKNSHAYKSILSTYNLPNGTAEIDAKLSKLTRTAAFLTGETTGFEGLDEDVSEQGWRSAFPEGMGSLSVNGAVSQAAYTLKSLLSSHCGVEPLPVDFAEETRGQIYQACLPQILDRMTKLTHESQKDEAAIPVEEGDFHSWGWKSAMVQSVTDEFDSQDVLDEQMGFRTVIAESTIANESSKHFPPKQPRVNYFGYPESETLDYLRDIFVDAEQEKNRLFVSHLTSSPHHPFLTPKDWAGETTYMNKQRWLPEFPFDNYLNTIKYQDDWLSQIFDMLHEVGALKETLIVLTGDHGLAFKSLDHSQSAVNNGHVSNFRIPLLFVHPDLPRLQVNVSATPTSILPTVLDLLSSTDSLPAPAAKVATGLLPRYEGNSLIRDMNRSVMLGDGNWTEAFFQPFHFSAINPGGSLLSISDASTSFRLVLPLCSAIPLRFTDTSTDPNEWEPITAWTMDELVAVVKVKHGVRAKEWVELAEALGRWWVWNQRGKWGYWGEARSLSRGGGAMGGSRGRVKLKHWWETKK